MHRQLQLQSPSESSQLAATPSEIVSEVVVELLGGALACAVVVALFFWSASVTTQGPLVMLLQGAGVVFAVTIMAFSALFSGARLITLAVTRRLRRPVTANATAS